MSLSDLRNMLMFSSEQTTVMGLYGGERMSTNLVATVDNV